MIPRRSPHSPSLPGPEPPEGAGAPSRFAHPDHGGSERDLLRAARDLKTTQGRREQRRFLIEGVRLLEDALDQQVPIALVFLVPHLLESTPRGRYLAQWLRSSDIPLVEVGERLLAMVADTEAPAGVVAVADLPEPPARLPAPQGTGVQAVLFDQVRDPGNAGGMLRTAAAAGVDHVVATQGSADLWAPKVVRAGAGAHFRAHLHGAQPPEVVEDWLAQWPQVVLADGDATLSMYAVDWLRTTVLILGNEAHGPSGWSPALPIVRARIPMRAETESLNVAAAAAILLYEGRRHLLRER